MYVYQTQSGAMDAHCGICTGALARPGVETDTGGTIQLYGAQSLVG